jgi:hypothetical protein
MMLNITMVPTLLTARLKLHPDVIGESLSFEMTKEGFVTACALFVVRCWLPLRAPLSLPPSPSVTHTLRLSLSRRLNRSWHASLLSPSHDPPPSTGWIWRVRIPAPQHLLG